MPAKVDRCVQSLLDKWENDPDSRPTPREKGQDKKSQAHAICTAAQNKSSNQEDDSIYCFSNIVMDGVLHLEEGEDGKERLRIPMLRQGVFRHPFYGKMKFDAAFMQSVIKNYKSDVVGYQLSLNARHMPELGALGWITGLELEKKQLVAFADPTANGLKVIKEGTYKYASAEVRMEYTDPETDEEHGATLMGCAATNNPFISRQGEIVVFSDEIDPGQYVNFTGGKLDMGDEEKTKELQTELEHARADVSDLQKQLDAQAEADKEKDTRIARLEAHLYEQKVLGAVAAAGAKTVDGRKLSPFVLNWASAFLLMGDVGEGDATIKLEDGGDYKAYVFEAVQYLLQEMERTVPVDGNTEGNERRLSDADDRAKKEREAGAKLWGDDSGSGGEE